MVKITPLRYGLSVVWISTLVNYIPSGEYQMTQKNDVGLWYSLAPFLCGWVIISLLMISFIFGVWYLILTSTILVLLTALILFWFQNSTTTPDEEDIP